MGEKSWSPDPRFVLVFCYALITSPAVFVLMSALKQNVWPIYLTVGTTIKIHGKFLIENYS